VVSANVALVKSAVDAWNRGDIARFASHASESVVWVEVAGRPEGAGRGELYGRERMRRSLESLFDVWESYELRPEQIVDLDDGRVLAIVREIARGRASGVEVDSRWGYVFTIEAGEIVRVEAHRDAELALREAGLG
jgi:ketosteroid isomerase-like protein